MYSYGWREYMPDIARWNGIDQLAESYLSTSTYAYVANNPISNFDVDGRWFNEDGSIDTSGRTPGFTSGRQMYQQFLGQRPGDGGGVSDGYNFTGDQAISMFNYFRDGGTMSGLSFGDTQLTWYTGTPTLTAYSGGAEIFGEIDLGVIHKATFSTYEPSFFGDFLEGVKHADKSNFISASALIGYGGLHLNKYEAFLKLGAKGGSISTLRNLSKNLKTIGKAGKYLGYLGVGLSVLEDVSDNKVGWGTVAKVALGVGLIYAGPVAIAYGITDLAVGVITGTTITDRIASGIDNSRLGTDFNIFSSLNK